MRGGIFYETLPPGVLRNQMKPGGTVTLGTLTLHVLPDVYEAGGQIVAEMQQQHKIDFGFPLTTIISRSFVA